ncbi:hypothetical protein HOC13_02950 [Candidatus Woesearchaeota archaeon]|nr:hypothetical protein [Candidatus Woesearchaeota archaeon]
MRIKGKKGVFLDLIVFIVLAAVGMTAIMLIPNLGTDHMKGTLAMNLMKEQVEVEKNEFYIDMVARYAVYWGLEKGLERSNMNAEIQGSTLVYPLLTDGKVSVSLSFKGFFMEEFVAVFKEYIEILGEGVTGVSVDPYQRGKVDLSFVDYDWKPPENGKTYVVGKKKNPDGWTNFGMYQDKSIEMGYDFLEYDQISNEAKIVFNKCKDDEDLLNCVNLNAGDTWEAKFPTGNLLADKSRLGFYTSEPLKSAMEKAYGERAIIFDVTSPNGYQYLVPGGEEDIVYQFAMVFLPEKPFSVKEINVYRFSNEAVLVEFSESDYATSYDIYFTEYNAANLVSKTDEEIRGLLGYLVQPFYKEIVSLLFKEELPTEPQLASCSVIKESLCDLGFQEGKVYFYGDKLYYVLKSNYLQSGKTYSFMVTGVKGAKESIINLEVEEFNFL